MQDLAGGVVQRVGVNLFFRFEAQAVRSSKASILCFSSGGLRRRGCGERKSRTKEEKEEQGGGKGTRREERGRTGSDEVPFRTNPASKQRVDGCRTRSDV